MSPSFPGLACRPACGARCKWGTGARGPAHTASGLRSGALRLRLVAAQRATVRFFFFLHGDARNLVGSHSVKWSGARGNAAAVLPVRIGAPRLAAGPARTAMALVVPLAPATPPGAIAQGVPARFHHDSDPWLQRCWCQPPHPNAGALTVSATFWLCYNGCLTVAGA